MPGVPRRLTPTARDLFLRPAAFAVPFVVSRAQLGVQPRRHSTSITLRTGEPVVTLARRLGHSSPAITLGYYAHFMPEAGGKGRTAID
ncbi:hypothetical protein ACFYW8_20790 [Streptomyces sp. NPDC002742]|uniref:hypothetical protein n=1 Tax=Streptomyces sp. NPDC002742 TaxID=3364663 RepID=UPI00368EEC50